MLRDDGWWQVSTTGGHRHFKHPTKRGRVTVSSHPSDETPRGTLASVVIRQAGLGRRAR